MSPLQHAKTSDAALPAGSPDFVAVLDHLGSLRFGGDDAATFLQGQLSCDLARVSLRSSSYGAYCSPKGRMLANFLLWRDEDGFTMALSRDVAAGVYKQLSRYVLRSKVSVADSSGTLVLAGAAGEQAARAFAGVFPELPREANEVRSVPGAGTAIRLGDGRLFFALQEPVGARA